MSSAREQVREYVEENRDMVVRVLHHGNEDARAYALALLLHADDSHTVEQVKRELDELC